MENNHTIEKINGYQLLLQSEQIELIDFDQFRQTLQDIEQSLRTADCVTAENVLLRDDIAKKIIGMEKAVTAVTNNTDSISETLHLIESLSALDAAALLKQYSRTMVRFRDAFPTTFEQAENIAKRKLHYHDYK